MFSGANMVRRNVPGANLSGALLLGADLLAQFIMRKILCAIFDAQL